MTEPTNQTCPFCGQPLVNAAAIRHLQRSQAAFEKRLAKEADVRAASRFRARLESVKRQEQKKASAQLSELKARALEAEHRAEGADDRAAAKTRRLLAQAANDHKRQLAALRREQSSILRERKAKLSGQLELRIRKQLRTQGDQREKSLRLLVSRLEAQNVDLTRRLEHVTAADRGTFSEADLIQSLHQKFPEDDIRHVGRGRRGADVLQTVRYKAGTAFLTAGIIVYECKDTQTWQNAFVDQLLAARALHQANAAVLVSKVFPRNERELCCRNDVVMVHPARAIHLVEVIRRMLIQISKAGLSKEDRADKLMQLYEYLGSERFKQALGGISSTSDQLTGLLRDEKQNHERLWTRRESAYGLLARRAAEIDESISQMIERAVARPAAKVVPLVGRGGGQSSETAN